MTVHRADFENGLLVKHRYFVALKPSPEAVAAIGRAAAAASIRKPNAPERLHLTLFVTEDFETEPTGLAETIQTALARRRIDAFDVTLTKYGHQGGSLVPGKARPLRQLQAQIARVLSAAGVVPRSGWKFNPHITLGYGQVGMPVLDEPIEPITWRALEFELVHSLLRLTIHRTLGCWQLGEQPRLL